MNVWVHLFCILCFLKTGTVFSLFQFSCPPYRVTDDNQALTKAVLCRIWLCPGQSVVATLCGESSFGDNFLRLFDTVGQKTWDDDYWYGEIILLMSMIEVAYSFVSC